MVTRSISSAPPRALRPTPVAASSPSRSRADRLTVAAASTAVEAAASAVEPAASEAASVEPAASAVEATASAVEPATSAVEAARVDGASGGVESGRPVEAAGEAAPDDGAVEGVGVVQGHATRAECIDVRPDEGAVHVDRVDG